MRTLLSSLVSSGGLLALVAFFLPWVAVSCNGQSLGQITPYDRATGTLVAPAASNEHVEVRLPDAPTTLEAEPGYWLLLSVAVATALIGLLFIVKGHLFGGRVPARPTGMASAILALLGLLLSVQLGLVHHLGLSLPTVEQAGLHIRVELQAGAWLSVIGYGLALSGGLCAAVLGPRVDRYG